MKKYILLLALIMVFVLTACSNESNVIGMQKATYTPDIAILYIYYFPTQNIAKLTFKQKDIDDDDYFLFRIPDRDVEKFYKNLNHRSNIEVISENEKKITFKKDADETAIQKVIEFIDNNNLYKIN